MDFWIRWRHGDPRSLLSEQKGRSIPRQPFTAAAASPAGAGSSAGFAPSARFGSDWTYHSASSAKKASAANATLSAMIWASAYCSVTAATSSGLSPAASAAAVTCSTLTKLALCSAWAAQLRRNRGQRRVGQHRFLEAANQRRNQDRADQRHTQRRAEVHRRPLQAAGLTAPLGRNGRHDDVAQLRHQQAIAGADQRQRDREAGGAQVRAGERDEQDQTAEHAEQAGGGDTLG